MVANGEKPAKVTFADSPFASIVQSLNGTFRLLRWTTSSPIEEMKGFSGWLVTGKVYANRVIRKRQLADNEQLTNQARTQAKGAG